VLRPNIFDSNDSEVPRPCLVSVYSSRPGVPPHTLHSIYTTEKRAPCPHPKVAIARRHSSRTSPYILEAIDFAVHAVEIVVTCCTPSTAPPSPGTPGTMPTTTTCARPRRKPSSPESTSLLFSLDARSRSNGPDQPLQ
jgi:hypothetical protein